MPPIPYPAPADIPSAPAAIAALDAALAAFSQSNTTADLTRALAARDTLGIALGPYSYGDPNPFVQEAYKQYFAAGAFLNARASSATASGQGVVAVAPPTAAAIAAGTAAPPVTYAEAVQQAEATLVTLGVSQMTEAGAWPPGFEVLPGESVPEATARRWQMLYGVRPPLPPSPTAVAPPDTIHHGGSTAMRPSLAGNVIIAEESDTFAGDGGPSAEGQAGADLQRVPSGGMSDDDKVKLALGIGAGVLVLLALARLAKRRKR